jgi:hypothetical protein
VTFTPTAFLRVGNPDLYAQSIAHAYFAGYRIYDPSTAHQRDPDMEAKMMRFPAIAAPLSIRHHSISGRRGMVVPPDDADEKDKALAKLVGKLLEKVKDFDKAKLNLSRADVTGARFAKIVKRAQQADHGDGKMRTWVLPHHLEDMPKENFRWAPDHSTEEPRSVFQYARKRAGRVIWMNVPSGAPLVRHVINDSEEMLGYGRGLRDVLSHLFTAMSRCFVSDIQAADRFGHGWLHLKLAAEEDGKPTITNDDLVTKSQNALNRMRSSWNFITGQGDTLEILGPPSSATEFMGKLTERLERMTDRVIMGASLFGGGGSASEGSYGRAETEADTSTIIFDACTGFLEDTITNDVVGAIMRDNRENFADLGFARAQTPRYEIVRGRKQDPKEAAERLEVVLRSGADVVKDEYYEMVQLSVPGEKDEVVAGREEGDRFGNQYADLGGHAGAGGDAGQSGGLDANGEPIAAAGIEPPNVQEISLALERSVKNGDRLTANITRKKLWAAMGETKEAPDISDAEWQEMGSSSGGEEGASPPGAPPGPGAGAPPAAPDPEAAMGLSAVGAGATMGAGIISSRKKKPLQFAEWDESKHSRGQPKNAGQFGPGGGGEGAKGKAPDVRVEATSPSGEPDAPEPPPKAIKNMLKVGDQLGSNEGGVYEAGINGEKFYVKKGKTPDHVSNEVLAGAIYKAAGVSAAEPAKDSLGASTVSPWVDASKASADQLAKTPGAQYGFAVDAWLANWDVVGTGYDNLMVGPNGASFRVDAGGSMLYRAQGTEKGEAWGGDVPELERMRKPGSKAGKVFGGLDDKHVAALIRETIAPFTNEKIQALQQKHFPGDAGDKLAKTLIRRRDYMTGWAKNHINLRDELELLRFDWDESLHPRGPDGKFKDKAEAQGVAAKIFDQIDPDDFGDDDADSLGMLQAAVDDGEFGFGDLAKLGNILEKTDSMGAMEEDNIAEEFHAALEDHSGGKGAEKAEGDGEYPYEMVRKYKGVEHVVTVNADKTAEYDGETYKSWTALAKKITGAKSISGPAFFKNAKKQAASKPAEDPDAHGTIAGMNGAKKTVAYAIDHGQAFTQTDVDFIAKKHGVDPDFVKGLMGDSFKGDKPADGSGGGEAGEGDMEKFHKVMEGTDTLKDVSSELEGLLQAPDSFEGFLESISTFQPENYADESVIDQIVENAQKLGYMDENGDVIEGGGEAPGEAGSEMTKVQLEANLEALDASAYLSDMAKASLNHGGSEGLKAWLTKYLPTLDNKDAPVAEFLLEKLSDGDAPAGEAVDEETQGHVDWHEANPDINNSAHFAKYDQLPESKQKVADAILKKSLTDGFEPLSAEGKHLLGLAQDKMHGTSKPEPHKAAVAGKDTSKSAAEHNEALDPPDESIPDKFYKGVTWETEKTNDGGWRVFGSDGTEYKGSSLTALAKQITGYKSISGPQFFGAKKGAKKAKAAPDPKGTPVVHAGGPPPEFKGWAGGDHLRVLDENGKIRDVRVVKQLKNGSALLLDQASGAYYESSPEGIVAWLKADASKVQAEPKSDLSPVAPGANFRDVIAAVFGKTKDEKMDRLTKSYHKLKEEPPAPPPNFTGTSYEWGGQQVPNGSKTAVANYTGSGSGSINSAMRGKIQPSSMTLKKINQIHNGINKHPDFDKPQKLLRGSGITGIAKHLGLPEGHSGHVAAAMQALIDKDASFTLNGFVSTSTSAHTAQAFSKGTKTGMLFEFNTPKALPVKGNSSHKSENELLLGHGWHYKPTGVRFDESLKKWVVTCDVTPKASPNFKAGDFHKLGTGK